MFLIKPETISWFLNRQLASYDNLKDLSVEDIDAKLAELDPKPEFFTKPGTTAFLHQKVLFYIGLTVPTFLFFADMGVGKTCVCLNIINYRKKIGQVKKALVLVPNVPNTDNWVEECKEHTPWLKAIALNGTVEERMKLLEQEADLYVINYAGLQAILDRPDLKKGGKKKRLILPEDIIDFASQFNLIVFDESVYLKNPKSITFKICEKLSEVILYRYGLSGHPFGRDAFDLWAQFYCVDRGLTLGNNQYLFRQAYFKALKRPWAIEWKLKPELIPLLNKAIKNRSIRYKTEECITLPQINYIPLKLELPEEARKYYRDTFHKLIVGEKTYTNINDSFIKMREITAGFLNLKMTDDMGVENKDRIVFTENPKLDELIELVKEIPPDCKVIIFHGFIFSGEEITKRLDKEKIGYRWLYGGTPQKLKVPAIVDFKKDEKVRVLVLNYDGAIGLNLQVANYGIFYEGPVAPGVRAQAEARIHRSGQTKPVFVYDLLYKRTVDENVVNFIKEGKDLLKAIIENKVILTEEDLKWTE